jgi:cytochrome c-type biogenesis protein CcmH/NrfG
MGRAQVAFTILASIVIFSMVVGTVAYAVIQTTSIDVTNDDDDPDEQSELESELRRDAEENPNDPQALANLANLLANTGKADESITWYEKAIALTPDDPTLRFDFAQTLVQSSKPNDAELQFQRVIELDPNNPQAHYYLAELYRAWTPPRIDEAIAEYGMVIEIGPDTFVAEQSRVQLAALGVATPAASATPASPVAEAAE